MKNNRITLNQFWLSMFICSLSGVLFIGNSPSVFVIALIAGAAAFNLMVVRFYKGNQNPVLKWIIYSYLTNFLIIVLSRFVEYMYSALGYGPVWLIAGIMLVFVFFCTAKGIEAISRAAAIITFFVVIAIIYIAVCCYADFSFHIDLKVPSGVSPELLLVFPSAIYVLLYDNIIREKSKSGFIYAGLTVSVLVYFLNMSAYREGDFAYQRICESSAVGIFKGSDCLLLAFLTIAAIYSASIPAISILKNVKNKNLTKGIYLLGVFSVILLSCYETETGKIILSEMTAIIITSITIIAILASLSVNKITAVNKNS